jgi:hypothetical protein
MKPTRFLESKWDTMKHDVVKLIGNFQIVQALQESKTSTKDTKYKKLYSIINQNIYDNNILHFALLVTLACNWTPWGEMANNMHKSIPTEHKHLITSLDIN